MRSIDIIAFDFDMSNEAFAHRLYADWDSFVRRSVEPVVDDVVTAFDSGAEYIEIESLELDLGEVTEVEFYDSFGPRLQEKLEEAMRNLLKNPQNQMRRVSIRRSAFEHLKTFLLTGNITWSELSRYGTIDDLFLYVLQNEGAQFKHFLQTYGHYTSLQRRLVYQLNDSALERGVGLMLPSESEFICAYVRMIKAKYMTIDRPSVSQTAYRYAVWMVVYAYVLNNRSSYFNRKSFVAQTISGLAAHLNVGFEYILEIITCDLSHFSETMVMPADLFVMLGEMRAEAVAKRKHRDLTDFVKLREELLRLMCDKTSEDHSLLNATELIAILADPTMCRELIIRLTESEIEQLVSVVIPGDSEFVINYARSLARQKERGALEGKAGTEFVKLKWLAIFPILLEDRGVGFNRKHFVRRVITSLAAHYNLRLETLLMFFINELDTLKIDMSLGVILRELYAELVADKHIATATSPDRMAHLLMRIRSAEELTDNELEQLSDLIADNAVRAEFIGSLNENERYQVVKKLYAPDSEFIISYAVSLDKSVDSGRWQGRVGSSFGVVKWLFMFEVLVDGGSSGFNRVYFAERVLRDIASHYNLSYTELLVYFHDETYAVKVPDEIRKIIIQLFDQERARLVEHIVRMSGDVAKYKLLRQFFGKQAVFVIELAGVLEFCERLFREIAREEGDARQKRLAEVLEVYKWEYIFSLLMGSHRRSFDKRRFVVDMLKMVAEKYGVGVQQLSLEVYSAVLSSEKVFNQEVVNYIKSGNVDVAFARNARNSAYHTYFAEDMTETDFADIADGINSGSEVGESIVDNGLIEGSNLEYCYIDNAGVVLLAPFLPRLFSMLGLTEDGVMKGYDWQVRAIFLIQYAVFGDVRAWNESALILNKLLVGMAVDVPIPQQVELTSEECQTVDNMIVGVMQLWSKMKNTSPRSFCEAFLIRKGKVESADILTLTVDAKAYDLILDSIPWSYNLIKYRWMSTPIYVKWR